MKHKWYNKYNKFNKVQQLQRLQIYISEIFSSKIMYSSNHQEQRGQGGQGKYVRRNNDAVDMHRKNSSPNQGVSIFIPNVWHSFNEKAIKREFIKCGWGFVERVDVVPSRKAQNLNNVFVHFRPKSWNMRSQDACAALTALQKKQSVKVFYSRHRYFNCFISTLPREQSSNEANDSVQAKDTAQAKADAKSFEDEFNESLDEQDNDSKAVSRRDRHPDSSRKQSSSTSISYGRANRSLSKRNATGMAGFFAAVESRRTYESACKLAKERRSELPSTFEFPGKDAPERVKETFKRLVYSHLGM